MRKLDFGVCSVRFLAEMVLFTTTGLIEQSVYFLVLKLALSLILVMNCGIFLGEVLDNVSSSALL